MAVKVNLYLDERRIETGEKAPVKLRLYISRTDIRHYHTNRYLTGEQFVSFIQLMKQKEKGRLMIGENRVQSAFEKCHFLKRTHSDLEDYFDPVLI